MSSNPFDSEPINEQEPPQRASFSPAASPVGSAVYRGSNNAIQVESERDPLLSATTSAPGSMGSVSSASALSSQKSIQKKKRRGPSKCNILWVTKAPKFMKYIFYSGKELTSVQTHLWACIIGVIVGLAVVAYEKALHGGVYVIWHLLFQKIQETGVFSERFPAYNYNWMVAAVLGIMTGVCLKVVSKIEWLKTPGNISDLIEKVHTRGYLSLNHFVPMFVTSVISISSGSSAGPEAAVMVITASIAGYIARQLRQSRFTTRILTLSGMAGGLAAFFGLPVGGALFVLEVPHKMGLQYYEALGPSVLCTLVSVVVAKSITQADLGGEYVFPDIPTQTWFNLFQGIISGVIGGIAAVIFVFVARGFKYIKKATNLDPLLAGLIGGTLVGALGVICPYSMFPGENEMQTILDSGKTGLPYAVTPGLIPMHYPLTALDFITIVMVKILAIGVTLGAGYPGGIIFPLFYTGASLGQAMSLLTGGFLPPTVSMMTMMAALESAVTRTPIGSCIIVLQIQKGFVKASTDYMAVFPSLCIGVWVTMFLTQSIPFYDEQRDRDDIVFHKNDPRLEQDFKDREIEHDVAAIDHSHDHLHV